MEDSLRASFVSVSVSESEAICSARSRDRSRNIEFVQLKKLLHKMVPSVSTRVYASTQQTIQSCKFGRVKICINNHQKRLHLR